MEPENKASFEMFGWIYEKKYDEIKGKKHIKDSDNKENYNQIFRLLCNHFCNFEFHYIYDIAESN